jgi:adenylosuccinate lyase
VVDPTEDLICPVDFRYGRPEVRRLFTRRARLDRALRVEAALALAEAELGRIPKEAAASIERAASGSKVTLARVDALEAELKHDVMAIARALAEQAGEAGAWVHYGATSADITESALALEHQAAARILRADLTDLARALLDLARLHRATPSVGRTHGQHAVPLSFGYKMAGAAAEVLRHRDRLDELMPRLAVGKMAGAVGTGAGFGDQAESIEERVMARLGLTADEAPTQLVGRDRIAELTNLLALVASTAERLATEVRNLQRTEIGEASEPFDESRQVGSSTMAQKRNPIATENVTSLARLVRALALPPLENMVLWHERDLSNSANERIVLPHAIVLTDDLLTKLTIVFRGLKIDTGRMAENLDRSKGNVMAENLMLALTARGVPRAEAHEMMRTLTRDEGTRVPLAVRAQNEPTITKWFSAPEILELLDPERYVTSAAAKTDRVIARLGPRLDQ